MSSLPVKKFVLQLVPTAKCNVIYRGFNLQDIEKIKPEFSLKEKYKTNVIIIFVGRLISGKGISDLLNAFSKIKSKNARCFIVGDSPERSSLEKLSKKLKIENRVVFFGHQTHKKTISILKIADIFVNPSYTEDLPTAVTEAALCHNTIIATTVGGTSEIITDQESSFLIKPKDMLAIKEKIEILIDNKRLRKKLSNNAYKEVKNKFNWNRSLKKYSEVFKKLKNNSSHKIF